MARASSLGARIQSAAPTPSGTPQTSRYTAIPVYPSDTGVPQRW